MICLPLSANLCAAQSRSCVCQMQINVVKLTVELNSVCASSVFTDSVSNLVTQLC